MVLPLVSVAHSISEGQDVGSALKLAPLLALLTRTAPVQRSSTDTTSDVPAGVCLLKESVQQLDHATQIRNLRFALSSPSGVYYRSFGNQTLSTGNGATSR